MDTSYHFIIVDDSSIDLFLAEKILQKIPAVQTIEKFDKPELAFEQIANRKPESLVWILLDIQMPVLNGFEFLQKFDALDESIKQHYTFIILTSSSNATDINRGKSNKYVREVLIKPLRVDALLSVISST